MNDRTIRQVKRDFAELGDYMATAEAKLRNNPDGVPKSEKREISEKAAEFKELQDIIDQYEQVSSLAEEGRQVKARRMPGDGRDTNREGVLTTPGHLFVTSDAYATYTAQGKQGQSGQVKIHDLRGGRIKLRGDEADRFMARLERKDFSGTLPDTDEDVFPRTMRDPETVRVQEPEILTIRDVLQTLPTDSDTVEYVRYTYTDAAEPRAPSTAKPYSAFTAEKAKVTVETIPVLHKVTEQDIDDAPRMIQIINEEMRRDVKVREEYELVWGDGTNNSLDGLFGSGDLDDYEFDRAQPNDTTIDTIRRMRTDVRTRRGVANAVLVTPMDWEDVELTKGFVNSTGDGHYVWGLVSDLRGPRIWSMRVIDSDAMVNPDDGSRRVLVGDFLRGATLYDRHDVRLAVGYVDDDFERNLRTLRAEERVALAIKRPWLFSWAETAAAES